MPDFIPTAAFTEDESIALFGVSLQGVIDLVSRAVREKFKTKKKEGDYEYDADPWCRDVFKDSVVFQQDGKLYSVPWEWKKGAVSISTTKTEMTQTYVPLEASASDLPALMADDNVIEREAKLFEAGSYPDKKLDVAESDLDTIVSNFSPVPVKIEHESTPFDGSMGTVKTVWRAGKDLMGKIAFPKAAWSLIESAKAKRLSAGVKRDKTGITEVSIVSNPRVATAQIFHDTEAVAYFSVGFDAGATTDTETPDITVQNGPGNEVTTMADSISPGTPTMDLATALQVIRDQAANPQASELFKANQELLTMVASSNASVFQAAESARQVNEAMREMNAQNLIEKFKREGKVTPAAEGPAMAILLAKPLASATPDPARVVKFKDGETEKTVDIAEAFVSFLEAMSPAVNFRELARSTSTPDVPAEASELFKKLGADPQKAAENLATV